MPFTSDDGTGREARVDPRDGNLKDTRDFAKDPKDFARESAERQESLRDRGERETYVERTEPRVEVRVEPREPKSTLLDKLLGPTQEACYTKQESLAKGAARAEVVTLGMCVGAGLSGGSNVPADIGCVSGIGVCAATEVASEAWKRHCGTLPPSSAMPPK